MSETTKKAKKFKGLKAGQVYNKIRNDSKSLRRDKSQSDNTQSAIGTADMQDDVSQNESRNNTARPAGQIY